jgi:hypothetical protein
MGPRGYRDKYVYVDRMMWREMDHKWMRGNVTARLVYLYLLTGPHAGGVSGLFLSGPMETSEFVGCSVPATKDAFAKLQAAGAMQFDPDTRVVWVPQSIRDNPPTGPNVVVGWRHAWAGITQCPLRSLARAELRIACEKLGRRYVEAFDAALPEVTGEWVGCSSAVSDKLQREIFERDGHRCVYCGAGGALTIDHKVPPWRGGSGRADNLVAACIRCNSRKGFRTPEEWARDQQLERDAASRDVTDGGER